MNWGPSACKAEEVQEYFQEKSVENKRLAFRIKSQKVWDIPGNFKNMNRKKGTGDSGLACPYCSEGDIMSQSHCLKCPAWVELRDGLDVTNIHDLVKFFRKLLGEMEKV